MTDLHLTPDRWHVIAFVWKDGKLVPSVSMLPEIITRKWTWGDLEADLPTFFNVALDDGECRSVVALHEAFRQTFTASRESIRDACTVELPYSPAAGRVLTLVADGGERNERWELFYGIEPTGEKWSVRLLKEHPAS